MLRSLFIGRNFVKLSFNRSRHFSKSALTCSDRNEEDWLSQDLNLGSIQLEDVDSLMSDDLAAGLYYPNVDVDKSQARRPTDGHNLVVVQPWDSYANFDEYTDPNLQLAECVSLGNTINNWKVIGKKVVFSKHINKKQIFGPKGFEEFKEFVHSHPGVSAVFFGLEVLSGIQLATLERSLRLPCYDRFSMVLNIFRQHARTKEAKLQVALAELPYIRSHLREIHESSEYSSTSESLKTLIGGTGEKFYLRRLDILKKRERRLRSLLLDLKSQREILRQQRSRQQVPTVSIVGYTNSGKTSLVKFLTGDSSICPKDQLFATLDITAHKGRLPSSGDLVYVDTVGFISRIPTLLVEAFSATLRDVQVSNLIVHVLDISHPDQRLQYATVINALKSLEVPKLLLDTKITVGNKVDLLNETTTLEEAKNCDFQVSITKGQNMEDLATEIDSRLSGNMGYKVIDFRVENGGQKYTWLRKNGSILNCELDSNDANYLICKVNMKISTMGRWRKKFGLEDILTHRDEFFKTQKQND